MSSNKEDTSKDALYCILEFKSTNPPVKEWIQELWAYSIQNFWN